MTKILITGGTGLLGTKITDDLLKSGHRVVHLSRSAGGNSQVETYQWDPRAGVIDERALENVEYIIHLAGAGIADTRWSPARKKIIIDSRVATLQFLLDAVKKYQPPLKGLVSASGIGYYGADSGEEIQTEASPSGNDFLAEVVRKWEAAADAFEVLCEVTKIRIGVVLSPDGGAMKEIMRPIKLNAGAPLGNGKQQMSWIHIDDLSAIFKFVIENNISGTFNATAPNPVSNAALTRSLAKVMKKPLWLPNVPGFVMKLILGEMAALVLGSCYVSSALIQQKGFEFKFNNLESALNDLLR